MNLYALTKLKETYSSYCIWFGSSVYRNALTAMQNRQLKRNKKANERRTDP